MRERRRGGLVRSCLAAYHYRRGQGCLRQGRYASAHRLFADAARRGHVDAFYQLGLNYSQGRGCPRSGSEALRFYKAAAEAGHRDAQFEIGVALLADHDAAWCAGPSARWAEATPQQDRPTVELVFPEGRTARKDE